MDRLGLDLSDGSSSDKQENPQGSHRQSIQRSIQSLVHACQCRDTNCRMPSCHKMKRVVAHSKYCSKKTDHKCPICKQLIALSRYHTKHCKENKCQVPLCLEISLELRQQRLQHRLQKAHLLRRKINSMQRSHTAAVTSTPTNQTSPSAAVQTYSEEKQAPDPPPAAMQTTFRAQDTALYFVHACQCHDKNCRMPSCHKMKRVVAHTKNCRKKTHNGCRICKQLMALCCYHAKHCNQNKCRVPFCLQIKHKLRQQQLKRSLQQAQFLQRRINSIQRSQTAAVTSTPTNQPLPCAAMQSYSGEKPAPGPPLVAMQAALEAQEAAQPQAGMGIGKPAMSTMPPPNSKPPISAMPRTIPWFPQQVQLPPTPQPPQQAFRAQPSMTQFQRTIPPVQQGVQRMPIHQPQVANAMNMQPFRPAGQVQHSQALQQLLHTLKSPNSPQQQQEVISILKIYPQLMAAFIKQRSQQGLHQQQQQLQQQHHQNPALQIPSTQQHLQRQPQRFSSQQELLWRQRLQQKPQTSQFQQPQPPYPKVQRTRMPFTQDNQHLPQYPQETMNYIQSTMPLVQLGVQRIPVHQPQVVNAMNMQPPHPAGQVQHSQALQQLLQTLKSPNSPQQQQEVISILKTYPQLMAAFIKQRSQQGLQQQQLQQQQRHQNPALQMSSMQQQPQYQPQNFTTQQEMLWQQRLQQQQQLQTSHFQQPHPPYPQQTRMIFTQDNQYLPQYPQKTMNYIQRTMPLVQQGVQRIPVHQPQVANAMNMQPPHPAGQVQHSQALQQLLQTLKSPNSPQQQQNVICILKTYPQLMSAFIKQRSQQGLQ